MALNKFIFSFICFSLVSAYALAFDIPTSDEANVHLLNRISFSVHKGDLEKLKNMGARAYIEEQLDPERMALPSKIVDELNSLKTLDQHCGVLYVAFGPEKKDAAGQEKVYFEAAHARLLRAIYSPRQLYEIMVDFWFNHFNVSITKGGIDKIWVGSYERDAIRPYALGNFKDLLLATAKHPAMLYYLDNWENKAPQNNSKTNKPQKQGLNENYAREVMELHTLGVNGGYTQADVIALAHILTGWGFSLKTTLVHLMPCTFYFDAKAHDFSSQRLLGQSYGGHGIADGESALSYLAEHPSTAKHISYQLAQYFVADNPSPELVDMLAKKFLQTKGDIKQVLKALFTSSYFWDPSIYGKKFKTPYQYIISCVRSTGISVSNYRPLTNALRQSGMTLYGCPTPDGYKNTQDAWLSSDALINRISFVTALINGRLPLEANIKSDDMTYKPPQIKINTEVAEKMMDGIFSENTRQVVDEAAPRLKSQLLLASPEFMRH